MLHTRRSALPFLALLGLAGCSTIVSPQPVATASFPELPYPTWTDADQEYRFFPGDEIALSFPSASELDRTLTVAPDGRIYPALVAPMQAADRTPTELKAALADSYSAQLLRPIVDVAPRSFVSQKIFVGGEVSRPGLVDLPGEIDPMQAVALAGGFLNTARRDKVVILRRGTGGAPYQRIVDLRAAWSDPASFRALPRLRRFDVVWVPKSRVAEIGLFTQQYIRDALPIGFSYTINGNTTR